MRKLSRSILPELEKTLRCGPAAEYPVKVLQFGEGNFMRAFIDWMIDEMNEQGLFNGSVRIIQPLPEGMGNMLNAQEGLYTLLLRGMVNGKAREIPRVVTCVRDCLNPARDWTEILRAFEGRDLRFIFSNTTESGIEYQPEPYTPGESQKTFPAKLAALMFHRFQKGGKGLAVIPCELIDRNGATLRECILHYAKDWEFPAAFSAWIQADCIFVNTLVDRIVAGYPRAEAESLCERFDYEDKLIDCGEIFHLFVIEGPLSLALELPFIQAGLNVVWTDCQKPYRERKVRFLNGGHTSSVLAAYLAGFDLVDRMTSDALFGRYLRNVLLNEVFPTIDLPDADKREFAESIIDRFLNPFANHQLISISLNSISKWKVRVMPSLLDYVARKGTLPKHLAFSLAALLAFYRAEERDGKWFGRRASGEYPVSDDADKVRAIATGWKQLEKDKNYAKFAAAMLGRTDFWEQDLNAVPGLTAAIVQALKEIDRDGMQEAVRKLVEE